MGLAETLSSLFYLLPVPHREGRRWEQSAAGCSPRPCSPGTVFPLCHEACTWVCRAVSTCAVLLLVLNQRNSLKTPNSRAIMTRTHQTPHAATYLWSGSSSQEGRVSKTTLEWGTHSVYRVLSLPHCLQIWGKDKRSPAYKGKKKSSH